jgi:hypothetical protein
MAWFISDQFRFYRHALGAPPNLGLTVVSDKLSGDGEDNREHESILRNLIDPDGENAPIVLTRSPRSDEFSGDLLADNLAGWLNAATNNPKGTFGLLAKDSPEPWDGWHVLLESQTTMTAANAKSTLFRPG